MSRLAIPTLAALLMTAGMINSAAAIEPFNYFTSTLSSLSSISGAASQAGMTAQETRVEHRQVQAAPAYRMSRPEVVSGSRLTVFANFLQHQQGVVYFDVAGTTLSCRICDWRANSVTFYVPRYGTGGPVDATIRVVLPNGRVAKSMRVSMIPQPTIVVHSETVGQPAPTAGYGGAGSFAGSW